MTVRLLSGLKVTDLLWSQSLKVTDLGLSDSETQVGDLDEEYLERKYKHISLRQFAVDDDRAILKQLRDAEMRHVVAATDGNKPLLLLALSCSSCSATTSMDQIQSQHAWII